MNSAPPLQQFGLAHLCAIALTLAVPIFFAVAFRRTKWVLLDRVIRFSLIAILVANYVGYVVYRWQHGYMDWREMLPMQLCDWTMIAVVVALLKENRKCWLEVAYFWGIGGSLQAILTPNLQFGFPDFRFFTFFLDHGAIVAGIIYLMLSRSFRPTHTSVWRTLLVVGNLSRGGARHRSGDRRELRFSSSQTGGRVVAEPVVRLAPALHFADEPRRNFLFRVALCAVCRCGFYKAE